MRELYHSRSLGERHQRGRQDRHATYNFERTTRRKREIQDRSGWYGLTTQKEEEEKRG